MAVSVRRSIGRLAACAFLAAVALGPTPIAQADDTPHKSFRWDHDLHAGDCTMFHGANFSLVADGYAYFYAEVTSSDDNDAWIMHARLVSADNRYLSTINNANPIPGDITKFVLNLPSSEHQYPWAFRATYAPEDFNAAAHIELRNSC
ncbi:DUF6294 family protein [Nocardia sp. NPDC050175]|uniref:DUF6294 family protein n=1 Tax=Nocardia sp. NPDC050175 TaxID=3364317 RepID=UPI00379104CC